ncbi:hypothetical protein [Flavobacterium frigoris]|uniref:Uncharacterized protein n=1 Tax=Flavobacterium frigoris TaxID=229204 RepID=A0A1H9MYN5_FLAFI|nr:hypothetical protein [Flavobacterium frigoris]SER28213.1 hypothetical protein SAMN05444355_10956 [Flavobacterium frigoris]
MGCDISTLSNHNLNLSSIEALANDLANRFGYTIEFGYYSHQVYTDLLGHDIEEDFVSLGSIEKTPFKKKYRLLSCNYQQKLLFEKHGDALFQMKSYWNWSEPDDTKPLPNHERIEEEKRGILIAEYDFEPFFEFDEYNHLTIYDKIVSNDFDYYARWWTLCSTIQERNGFDEDCFKNYRLQKAKLTCLLGGDKLYYVNDQSKFLEGVGQGSESEFTWKSLEKHILEKLGDCLISISQSVLDKQYLWRMKLLDEIKIGFMDDFEDIKDMM